MPVRELRFMKRLHCISRRPERAADIAPEVKLAFISDIIAVSIPLFQNKAENNPVPDSGTE